MAKVISYKTVKIKPENAVVGEGTVARCKYAGSSSVGIGPLSKTTHIYKVYLDVEGVDKQIVVKVKEKQGWNASIVDNAMSIGKMFSKKMPINEGEKLSITYDKSKPKKCNINE